MPKRELILVRHAHRDIQGDRAIDNGLSPKGREQAQRLVKFMPHLVPSSGKMVSSPKKRCVETLLPLSRSWDLDIALDERLLEQLDAESEAKFAARIGGWWNAWRCDAEAVTIACSHGGFIPQFLKLVTGSNICLKKGGLAHLSLEDGFVHVENILQVIP